MLGRWPFLGDTGLDRPLEIGRQHHIAARRGDAKRFVEASEQAFQRSRIFGADLQQHAGVAGNGVDLLDLRILGNRHQLRGLAPAPDVDRHEGKQRLFHRLGAYDDRGAANGAAAPKALDPFIGGGR